jgi:hypothetical protein
MESSLSRRESNTKSTVRLTDDTKPCVISLVISLAADLAPGTRHTQ